MDGVVWEKVGVGSERNSEGSTHDLFVEYRVHHGLEGSGRVGESKEHYRGFEKSLIGYKCCLVLVFRYNLDHVVSPANVDCGD